MQLPPFGRELRKLRVDHNMTLADLAGRLQCSVAHVSALERGIKTPTRAILRQISQQLNLNDAQDEVLGIAALQGKQHLDLSEFGEDGMRLFSTLSFKARNLENDALSALEEAIRDDDMRDRVLRYAKKLVEKKRHQLEFDFGQAKRAKTAGLKRLADARQGDITGYRVPPIKLDQIRALAEKVRETLGITASTPFHPIRFMDMSLKAVCPDFDCQVLSNWDFVAVLVNDEGMALKTAIEVDAFVQPATREIVLPERVYHAANQELYSAAAAKARFTVTHEIAHALLHKDLVDPIALTANDPPQVNSEWQANELARHILLSPSLIDCASSDSDIAHSMFVTLQNVSIQRKRYHRTL